MDTVVPSKHGTMSTWHCLFCVKLMKSITLSQLLDEGGGILLATTYQCVFITPDAVGGVIVNHPVPEHVWPMREKKTSLIPQNWVNVCMFFFLLEKRHGSTERGKKKKRDERVKAVQHEFPHTGSSQRLSVTFRLQMQQSVNRDALCSKNRNVHRGNKNQ